MAEYDLYVKLDTSATPPVTVYFDAAGSDPAPSVDVDTTGTNTLKWQPVTAQDDQWSFDGIAENTEGDPLPNPPFTSTTVQSQEIEVEDDNEENDPGGTSYSYVISIDDGGTIYKTDPMIVNKPGNS